MQLSDFNLTAEQRDEVLTEEVNRRVRKGATLLECEDNTAILRFGPEPGRLDFAYIIALWVFNILMLVCTLGFWLIPMAACWGLFHKVWRKIEVVKVHDNGQIDIITFGKTISFAMEARMRSEQS